MPSQRTSKATTPLQQSAAVPALDERKKQNPPVGTGDSRSFPGQPSSKPYGGAGGAAMHAKRSLSDDRSKALSMSELTNPEEEEELVVGEDGEPLLKSAWMSIVGAAGRFLGRAQERHQWSEARVGMMNRLLSKKPSTPSRERSFIVEDERVTSGSRMLRPISNSRTSQSTGTHGDNDISHSVNSMCRGAGGGGASISATRGHGTDWADGTSSTTSNVQQRDRDRDHRGVRERDSSERSLPHVSGTVSGPSGQTVQNSGSGSGQHSGGNTAAVRFHAPDSSAVPGYGRFSVEQGLEGFELRDGRRGHLDHRKKQPVDDVLLRPSNSGSNSTRASIPMMPPLPRQKSQQLHAAEPAEDHLHGLLAKLRARRLGQEAAGLGFGDGAGSASGSGSGAGPSPRRQGSQDLFAVDSHTVARRHVSGPFPGPLGGLVAQTSLSGSQSGSRMMRQRFSALLAPDAERRPFDATRPRQAIIASLGACDTATTERVADWLASAGEGSVEAPPVDDNPLSPDPGSGSQGLPGTESASISRHESLDRESSLAGPSSHRPSSLHESRQLMPHGQDAPELSSPGSRPWKSLNGGHGQLPLLGVHEGTEDGYVRSLPLPPKGRSPTKSFMLRHSPQKAQLTMWQLGEGQAEGDEEDEDAEQVEGGQMVPGMQRDQP